MEVLDREIESTEPRKFFHGNIIDFIRFAIPAGIVGMLRLTMKAENFNLDGGPDLYGFPMAFMSGTWVNSFEHEIYLLGLIVDLSFYALFAWLLLSPFTGLLKRKGLKNLATFGIWGLAISKLLPFIIFFDHLRFPWVCRHTTEYMEYSFHYGFIPF